MANYKEQTIQGQMSKWRRIHKITITNEYNLTSEAVFYEEEVTILPDGSISKKDTDYLNMTFDPNATFDLLNPTDDSVIGSATEQQLYVLIYSMARKLQNLRDNPPPAPTQAPPPPPVDPVT